DIAFDLTSGAASVYIQIHDSAGTFVADINAGALSAGNQAVQWDGKSSNGDQVDDGVYTFSVMAVDAAGSAVSATSYVTGTVTGVDYASGETLLLLGSRTVPVSAMVRVEEPLPANAGG
ncbi:hypothetical protein LJC47_08035, partial [Desulfosarcina sp. OttesenSCG-928-B08]|nr:hypothetical protein [Desulfosarcina sp. OttesenSCG-928-B08]